MAHAGVPKRVPTAANNSDASQLNFVQSIPSNNVFIPPNCTDNEIRTHAMLDNGEGTTKKGKVATAVHHTSNYTANPLFSTVPNPQTLQHTPSQSAKIQIKHQPRAAFRPRTQNESRSSSHYIRCEDDVEADYPTIYVPQIWAQESTVNIIEVMLVDIQMNPHPYSLHSKTSTTLGDERIFAELPNKPNIVYFRLTNDDFLAGFKTFMIEMIKSKQDNVITKELIRVRSLHQSMLRFTRIYQNQQGEYQCDIGNEDYSRIMTESYGGASVEHIGPRYGPMCGLEMLFIVFKGRVVKDDLSITVSEQESNWCCRIDSFILNGNVVCFPMPPFPNPQRFNVQARIDVHLKQDKSYRSPYLYTNSLTQELLRLDSVQMISADAGTDPTSNVHAARVPSRQAAKNKSRKRLLK